MDYEYGGGLISSPGFQISKETAKQLEELAATSSQIYVKTLTEKEQRLKDLKEKLATLSAQDIMQELMLAAQTARQTKSMEKYRVDRRRKNKAAAKSRARNR